MNLNGIKVAFFILVCFLTNSSFGQNLTKEAVFCEELSDTLLFNVWLPYGYEKNKEEYPAIYFHAYGALSNYGMNVAAELNKRGQKFPKTIVVELTGSTKTKSNSENIDFSYFREGLTANGERYLHALQNDIFPYVKEKFATSDFRTYLGHSYYASYANLLFTNYPDTFDAYILFAPESLNEVQENFQLDTTKYNYESKFYFVTTGSKDIPKRLAFNKLLSSKVGSIGNIHFESQIEDLADHNSIVDYGLNKSLTFLYKEYFNVSQLDSASLIKSYLKQVDIVKTIYKMKTFSPRENYYDLYSLGSQFKDKEFIKYLLSAEKEISSDPLHLFNVGYIFIDTFNDRELAIKYYQKSIEVSLSNNTPKSSFNAYSWLAHLYSDDKNYKKAFTTLEEGFRLTGSHMLLYQAARLAEDDKSLMIKSKQYLTEIIKHYNGSDLELFGVKIDGISAYLKNIQQRKSTSE